MNGLIHKMHGIVHDIGISSQLTYWSKKASLQRVTSKAQNVTKHLETRFAMTLSVLISLISSLTSTSSSQAALFLRWPDKDALSSKSLTEII